jgi:tetratricopeptide (TPR) repeat protein
VQRRSSPSAKRIATHGALLIGALWVAMASSAQAQSASPRLAPKRTLTVGPAPGCAIPPSGPPAVRRDNAEARRLALAGQEAALIGDQSAARDAFVRAATLNPGDERIAYDLARAHEELADSTRAISEFCRYLTLSPGGREAADVRDRLLRLVPALAQRRAADVQVAFRLGLALFDDARYDAATRAFDDVVRGAAESPEGYFNRGLARAAAGQRAVALLDFEQYRVNAPTVDDRVEVGRAIEVLRRPVYSPGKAFATSLLPGVGQFYTGHTARGFLTLLGVGGGLGAAFVQKSTTETIAYTDPNGVAAPYTRTTQERSYFIPGVGAAAGFLVVGMIDAIVSANRSQRGADIVARPTRAAIIMPLLPRSRNERGGVMVAVRF